MCGVDNASAANTVYLVNHVADIHDTRYIYKIHKNIPDDKIQMLSHAIKNGDAPVSKLIELFSFTGNKSEQLRVIGESIRKTYAWKYF